MCLVEVEKTPKLQVGCTLPVAEGMVVHTDSPQVHQARKGTLEFLLTNHPLDCPVCDKGGECELQDMTFRYGMGESRFLEQKMHVDEQQWSPVVFYDKPRCILCYRCVRICDEGMGVKALGVVNRGAVSEIAPNHFDHLECDECGMCIDICPVGALTSGSYRYKTRPWEMKHVGTICTHCADGCKTTLGVRNGEIIRGNNRDRSGINGEFLCIKGRYAFDFVHSAERLQSPMVRKNGELAAGVVGRSACDGGEEIPAGEGRAAANSPSSAPTTPPTKKITICRASREKSLRNQQHRSSPHGRRPGAAGRTQRQTDALATSADLYERKAILVISSDLAQQHPFLRSRFAPTTGTTARISTRLRRDRCASSSTRCRASSPSRGANWPTSSLYAIQLKAEPELVILFGDAIKGGDVHKLVAFGASLGIPVRYVCLVDYSNSRGASDMGCRAGSRTGLSNRSPSRASPTTKFSPRPIWMFFGWWARIR